MPLNKYFNELENLEKKQQNIYAITIIILAILSLVENSIYKQCHSVIIYILLAHIYILYYSLPQKSISFFLCIIGFTAFTVCYLASFYKLDSIYLVFISVEFALGALYNVTKSKLILLFTVALIILLPFIGYIVNIEHLTGKWKSILRFSISTFDWIIISIIVLTKVHFIRLKNDLRIKYSKVSNEVDDDVDENLTENIDAQMLDELIQLAYKNHLSFIVKFKEYYPLFTMKVEELAPNIVIAEFEVIALLKLNFTTKEIAVVTNSTVRSIESKKYRIRKKLSIPSSMDMSMFFSRF